MQMDPRLEQEGQVTSTKSIIENSEIQNPKLEVQQIKIANYNELAQIPTHLREEEKFVDLASSPVICSANIVQNTIIEIITPITQMIEPIIAEHISDDDEITMRFRSIHEEYQQIKKEQSRLVKELKQRAIEEEKNTIKISYGGNNISFSCPDKKIDDKRGNINIYMHESVKKSKYFTDSAENIDKALSNGFVPPKGNEGLKFLEDFGNIQSSNELYQLVELKTLGNKQIGGNMEIGNLRLVGLYSKSHGNGKNNTEKSDVRRSIIFLEAAPGHNTVNEYAKKIVKSMQEPTIKQSR